MKRNSDNLLLAAAAMIVLLGMGFATGDVLADEAKTSETEQTPTSTADDGTVERARSAQEAAVSKAAESFAKENQLDLDIRLGDRTSTLAARTR